jgi:hypothetical protein
LCSAISAFSTKEKKMLKTFIYVNERAALKRNLNIDDENRLKFSKVWSSS